MDNSNRKLLSVMDKNEKCESQTGHVCETSLSSSTAEIVPWLGQER